MSEQGRVSVCVSVCVCGRGGWGGGQARNKHCLAMKPGQCGPAETNECQLNPLCTHGNPKNSNKVKTSEYVRPHAPTLPFSERCIMPKRYFCYVPTYNTDSMYVYV